MSDGQYPVFILDELAPKAAKAQTLYEHYMEFYVPGAIERGMTLLHALVEPGFWLEGTGNRLVFLWFLPGPVSLWHKNFASRQDPNVRAFWATIEPMISERRRATLVNGKDIEIAINV